MFDKQERRRKTAQQTNLGTATRASASRYRSDVLDLSLIN
jgi:hypothetical protein